MRWTPQAREARLWAGNSPVSSIPSLLPSDGVSVDKTSWVMGSRKLVLGLRKKRSVSSFEQADEQTLLKYLFFF